MKKSLPICLFASFTLTAAVASAGPLTLNALAANQQYQQTSNNPCVIGENSCDQPANFPHTILAAGSASSYDAFSPSYTVGFLRNYVGNEFVMGFDVNQATGSGVQSLSLFEMRVNGNVVDSVSFNPATLVGPTAGGNNGNGYADYLITGFTSLFSYNVGDLVTFHAVLPSVNDGAEQFFLVDITDSNPPPPPPPPPPPGEVPEPATLVLLGSGLLFAVRRMRNRV